MARFDVKVLLKSFVESDCDRVEVRFWSVCARRFSMLVIDYKPESRSGKTQRFKHNDKKPNDPDFKIFLPMSLEFALQYSCPLRANYSESHLREWGRLTSLHAKLTTGDESAPSVDKIEWVENARDEVEKVQQATMICRQCPACLPFEVAGEGESVGCLGRINYPIEAQFEKFLADRIQLSLDTLDKDDQPRLLRILVDSESPFDGEATKELRRVVTDQGLRFFELRIPISLTREAIRLSTDNIFDLLAGFRSEDSTQTSYTREFPFEAVADYYDFLDLILRNELSQSEVARLTARSRNYTQFLRLLTAIEKAEVLNARVLID